MDWIIKYMIKYGISKNDMLVYLTDPPACGTQPHIVDRPSTIPTSQMTSSLAHARTELRGILSSWRVYAIAAADPLYGLGGENSSYLVPFSLLFLLLVAGTRRKNACKLDYCVSTSASIAGKLPRAQRSIFLFPPKLHSSLPFLRKGFVPPFQTLTNHSFPLEPKAYIFSNVFPPFQTGIIFLCSK